MNGHNDHHTGWQHQTPERDSKGWIRIVARGCGGTRDYWGEFDCSHGYIWNCEDCPICILSEEEKEAAWAEEHQGPPRPEHMRPDGWELGMWDEFAVSTELHAVDGIAGDRMVQLEPAR